MANPFGPIDNIVLKDYSPEYPALYELEKTLLLGILGNNCKSIHHIGSTAIPGIKSKPIVDINIAAYLFPIADETIEKLKQAGYIYWDKNPEPGHQFFLKGMPRTHHLHIYPAHSDRIRKEIFFRDYLIQHPDAAKRYERLKLDLASRFYDDREKYTESKTEFVDAICRQSELSG